jgi:hypothetical protein
LFACVCLLTVLMRCTAVATVTCTEILDYCLSEWFLLMYFIILCVIVYLGWRECSIAVFLFVLSTWYSYIDAVDLLCLNRTQYSFFFRYSFYVLALSIVQLFSMLASVEWHSENICSVRVAEELICKLSWRYFMFGSFISTVSRFNLANFDCTMHVNTLPLHISWFN